MQNSETIFLNSLKAMGKENVKQLEQLLHPYAAFEFPYALPSTPEVIQGRAKIIDYLLDRKFTCEFLDPIYIESTPSGNIYAEILAEESFTYTGKTLRQHLICKAKVKNGRIIFYKEFFNPITRLEGLLDLDRDNFIIL